jgi:hypothetical protein
MKWQKVRENCIMRSLYSSPNIIILYNVKRMGNVGKPEGKRPL